MTHLRIGTAGAGRALALAQPAATRRTRRRAIRSHRRAQGVAAGLLECDDQKDHRKQRGSRGGHPTGPNIADDKNRNVLERAAATSSSCQVWPPATTGTQ